MKKTYTGILRIWNVTEKKGSAIAKRNGFSSICLGKMRSGEHDVDDWGGTAQ